jgi:Tfp pilus assembly protein PilX
MTPRRLQGKGGPPAHGSTLFVVMILLVVMMLGGLAAARMTEVATLASGNSARRDAALQASEIGVNTAYAAVKALADTEASVAPWYYAVAQAQGADGLPTLNFDATPQIVVGAYTVNYVVERLCAGTLPLDDAMRQCLVKQVDVLASAAGGEAVEPPMSAQFRITVRVSGPKNTRVWVQSLVTKGVGT